MTGERNLVMTVYIAEYVFYFNYIAYPHMQSSYFLVQSKAKNIYDIIAEIWEWSNTQK